MTLNATGLGECNDDTVKCVTDVLRDSLNVSDSVHDLEGTLDIDCAPDADHVLETSVESLNVVEGVIDLVSVEDFVAESSAERLFVDAVREIVSDGEIS